MRDDTLGVTPNLFKVNNYYALQHVSLVSPAAPHSLSGLAFHPYIYIYI